MPLIKIRQLEERTATNGLFMGDAINVDPDGTAFRRKLEPGEIVEIPEDETLPDGRNLMEALWSTGCIDICPDTVAVTRPLDYKNRREAMLCAPSFHINGKAEQKEMEEARAAVDARLFEQSESPPEPVESPVPDEPTYVPPAMPPPELTAGQPRKRRRPVAAANHGSESATT